MVSFTRIKMASSLAAILLGTLLTSIGPSAHAQSAGLRLMAVGDSITAGYQNIPTNSNNGYRGPLYSELISQGDALDFVGSQRHGVMFDPDNEGYYGDRIDQISGLISGELALYQPNVVLLHIGTNDLGQNIAAYPASTAPARLASLIDQIFAADPGVTVLVAQLICNKVPSVQALTDTYNAQIPGIVQARANAGKHVLMVSMSTLTTADLSDNIHPNDGGYQKMADAWNAGIKQVIANGWVAPISFAGRFEIQSVSCGQVLDVSGGSTANNASVIQWPYQGNANQFWNFIPTSSGYYQIKNAYSALDLNVVGVSTTNGAKIVQYQFGTQGNDQWLPVRQSDGSYVFYNRNSGSLLDSPGVTTQNADGTTTLVQLDQWGANGGTNQRFNVIGR